MAHPQLYISDTHDKGRGVFTKKPIKEGIVVESAPVVVMDAEDRILIDQTKLKHYIFQWQPDGKDMCCMALGLIPLFNHSYRSNCEYFMDYDTNSMFVQTVRDIKAGEELTINYNATWDDQTKIWFDAV